MKSYRFTTRQVSRGSPSCYPKGSKLRRTKRPLRRRKVSNSSQNNLLQGKLTLGRGPVARKGPPAPTEHPRCAARSSRSFAKAPIRFFGTHQPHATPYHPPNAAQSASCRRVVPRTCLRGRRPRGDIEGASIGDHFKRPRYVYIAAGIGWRKDRGLQWKRRHQQKIRTLQRLIIGGT